MAKTVTCTFCGKEITKGFLSGDAENMEIADLVYVDLCPECAKEYKKIIKIHKERFTTKLANYKWENRCRPNSRQVGEMYVAYLNECGERMEQLGDAQPTGWGYFYAYDNHGRFGWTERRVDFMGSDISANDKIKALEKNIEVDFFGFDKNDISCIEFRLTNADDLGLFKKAYSVEICLNHERDLTFKPCFGKTVVMVSSVFGHKKKAAQQVAAMLDEFRQKIGSDLPIRQVRKFR